MLVLGAVNDLSVRILVDTGAAVSMLSSSFAQKACIASYPPNDGTSSLVGPDGKPLKLAGTTTAKITLGDTSCLHCYRLVKGLRYDCIVGRDVLSHIPCTISSGEGRLFFSTQPANVSTVRSTFGSLRLGSVAHIPPRHEVTVLAKLRRPGTNSS